MRFGGVTPVIRSGLVHIPDEAPWLDEYVRELCAFPNTRYADQVDSTSQFLAWVREQRSTARNWIEYYKWRAERDARPEGPPTNDELAAAGLSHVDAMLLKSKLGMI